MTDEKKSDKLRNFTFLQEADDRLVELAKEKGQTMTKVIEDLLLGRRQFEPDIEKFISEETAKDSRSRKKVIEEALKMMRERKMKNRTSL